MTTIGWIVVAVIVIGVIAIIAAIVSMGRRSRLRALPDESRARYADNWRTIETLFVDHPRAAVAKADELAVSIYRERGAEMDGGGRVPSELEKARERAHQDGEHEGAGSQTEHLRRAMVAYQRIVDEAVGESTRRASEARRREVAG